MIQFELLQIKLKYEVLLFRKKKHEPIVHKQQSNSKNKNRTKLIREKHKVYNLSYLIASRCWRLGSELDVARDDMERNVKHSYLKTTTTTTMKIDETYFINFFYFDNCTSEQIVLKLKKLSLS